MDHRPLLAPFIEAGFVTHVFANRSKDRGGYAAPYEDMLNNMHDCINNFGSTTEWLGINDGDESLVINWGGKGKSVLGPYLDELEKKHKNLCQVSHIWQFLAPERYTFVPNGTLLDNYPYICFEHSFINSKSIFHPTKIRKNEGNIQHYGNCFDGEHITLHGEGDKSHFVSTDGSIPYRATLLHYYSRSVQEQIWKKEQSVGNMIREIQHLYDDPTFREFNKCRYEKAWIGDDYLAAFREAMALDIPSSIVVSMPAPRPHGDPDEP